MEALERRIDEITLARGVTLEEDWFALKPLDAGTLAIGEPAYHQCNWSYLITDAGQSLLWDTGSGRRAIAPVVARHAGARVTAFPSHLHYDHLGGIGAFGPVMLADLPMLRALAHAGRVTPTEALFLGQYEGLSAPTFEVGRWVRPGEVIAVGTREFEVLHTPGHSPDSVCLWEAARGRLYAADFIYPGPVYAQVPGARLHDYLQSCRALLAHLPRDVQIFCAHGQEEAGAFDVPTLGYGDLEALARGLETVLGGPAHAGERQVSARMSLLFAPESFPA